MVKRISITASFVLMLGGPGFGQDFIEGINLYNRAQYDSLIYVFAPQFILAHPQEEGLARYFSGESYYNKALAETNRNKSRDLFNAAWSEFAKAKTSADFKLHYPEYFHAAYYKMAWCSYRLAELNERPGEMLKRASREFLELPSDVPDSLRIFSLFMAADCKIRESLFNLYDLADANFENGALPGVMESVAAARQWLDSVIHSVPSNFAPHNILDLQTAAAIKRASLNYYLGKLYQMLPPDAFAAVNDPQKKSDARQTALFYFQSLNYDSLRFASSFAPQAISYLNLMKQFNLHLLNRNAASQNRFKSVLNELRGRDLIMEGHFRLAGVYHSLPEGEEGDFNQQALSFYDSSSAISEADYWMANIYMIEDEVERSREHFQQFIAAMSSVTISNRGQILFEDAQIKKFLLDFETFYLADQTVELQNLAEQVEAFYPRSQSLRQRLERLKVLMHLALINNPAELWASVLTGSDEEKLQQALDAIMFVLSRAALNIGVTREKYILLLSPLFEITQTRRSDAARFFKGIVKTLEAEIQARPDEKVEIYKTAAALLSGIHPDYEFKDEADYVRGICLFYAEDFEQARQVFLPLINQKRYLRALFYMAEIFRYSGQGRAARECYQAIVAKLKDSRDDFSEYWFVNALAGIASSDDSGDLTVLANIDIQNIEFLPPLNEKTLIFERLADESFLRQQLTRENITMLARFGLPQKECYPSRHVLRHSLFVSENIFTNFPHLIDEMRGALSSTLKLTVILPKDIAGECEVFLNHKMLTGSGGIFYSPGIPLNSEYEILVQHPQCYLYRQLYKFSKPGEDAKVVVLTRKIDFSRAAALKRTEKAPQLFEPRWDGNVVLNHLPPEASSPQLKSDFARFFELRDVAFDRTANRFLAVHANENKVLAYSQRENGSSFAISWTDSLKSPEGLALDSRGHIFIADWGHHRIVETDNTGQWLRSFASFGNNTAHDIGKSIKLMFPTRVAVVEDHQGVQVGDNKWFGEPYLFIADHNGIHVCNLRGEYLGTVLSPNEDFPRGSFYAFTVERKQSQFVLRVVGRSEKSSGRIFEFMDY